MTEYRLVNLLPGAPLPPIVCYRVDQTLPGWPPAWRIQTSVQEALDRKAGRELV